MSVRFLNRTVKHPFGFLVLCFVAIALAFFAFWHLLPEYDPPAFFAFADHSVFVGVPHAGDVLSNLAFLFAGFFGLWILAKKPSDIPSAKLTEKSTDKLIYKPPLAPQIKHLGKLLAWASILTCFGSAYFHWDPTPERLFWDRLPMTLGFSSIAALLVSDRIELNLGKQLAMLLMPAGFLTVIGLKFGWINLRPYLVLQFGTLALIAIIAIFKKPGVLSNPSTLGALALYLLARKFESLDILVFNRLGVVSGHTLKHIAAALSIATIFSGIASGYRRGLTNQTSKN